MTDQITVSREMLRHARSLCMEVRQQSSPRMVALAMPLWAAINRALEQPAVEAVHEFAETCPYCNFNGRNNCANVADEIRKNGETPGSGHCSNYQAYGKRTAPQAQQPADVPLLTNEEIKSVIDSARGNLFARSGGTSERIAKAIEQAVRRKVGLK